jgi:P-type Cu2+ transporter
LFAVASIVYFYGGWPFLKGLVGEIAERKPGMMLLVAVAISAAFFYSAAVTFGLTGVGFYWELATLVDVMLLGHWIEMRSVMGASSALEALVRLLPSEAHRLKADESTEEVTIDRLVPGDKVLVKPGERVPTDGVIVAGITSLDESMLTGESKPVEKGESDAVIGGSVNGDGAITVEIRKTGGETYLAQVLSNTTACRFLARSNAARSRMSSPWLAERLMLTATASGTARPSAWGQAITITVTARASANSS